MTRWVFAVLALGWLLLPSMTGAAPPEADLATLIRFYNHRINEHAYAYLPDELGQWRQVSYVKEHYALGRVATRQLPGTVPLYRMLRKTDRRHFYALAPLEPRDQFDVDRANFNVFVWTQPGDGRIPIFASTWIDRSDVYLERDIAHVNKFFEDSKRDLKVERLSPVTGAFFYVYPNADEQANGPEPNSVRPNSNQTNSNRPPTLAPAISGGTSQPVAHAVRFEALALKHPATGLAMSEDGRLLLIAHQTANSITVYDILQQATVAEIACPAPRSIVARGSKVIVGNFGQGTITVIDSQNGWKIDRKIRLPKLDVLHLSAASGAYFDGHVLVTTHGGNASQILWVNINGQDKPELSKAPIGFVSADGHSVMLKEHYGVRALSLPQALTKGLAAADLYRGGESQETFIHQVAPGGYWFGMDMIMGGVPIQPLPLGPASMVIPDHSQPLFYVVNETHLKAHQLATTFPQTAEQPVEWPANFADKSQIFSHLQRLRSFDFNPPVAWTHGRNLHMFLLTAQGGQILRSQTLAFQENQHGTYKSSATDALVHLMNNSSQDARVKFNPRSTAVATAAATVTIQSDSVGVNLMQGFPSAIAAGKEFRHRWHLPPRASLELLSNIPGVVLSASGDFRWTPTVEQLGKFELKVRVARGDQIDIQRLPLEVADAALLASLGGDLSKFDTVQRIQIEPGDFQLVNAASSQKVMLLQGDTLTLLASNGFENPRKLQLPKRYRMVADRRDYLVAIAQDECSLDLINKSTLKVTSSIPLERPEGQVDATQDLALDPVRRMAYATVRHDNLVPKHSVLRIDETTGKVTPMSAFGTWVAVSPDGQRIFTGHRDVFQRGRDFHINPNWSVIEIPRYGSVDVLMIWDPRDEGTILQANPAPGANGQGLRLSPDGRRAVYLSYTGDAGFAGDLIGWNTADLDKDPVRYSTKDIGSTTDLAFHPWLPLLAVPGKGTAVFFDQDSGKQLSNMLLMPTSGVGEDKIERLHFSIDGKHLLFVMAGATDRYIRSVKLRIDEKELKQPRREPVKFDAAKPKASLPKKNINFKELTAFQAASDDKTLTPKEIGRKYLDAVVTIQTNTGSGSGFFIGPAGYLLTSAHVIEDAKQITVIHNKAAAGKPFEAEASLAELIVMDVRLDAALLKINTDVPLTLVQFAAEETVETGEPVTVIGNPGAGRTILNRTMTSGIVSNAERVISGVPYLQTSAAINPGNSGGAMFDSRGQVIGMVNLKARIEGAAFALPTKEIRQFLTDVTR